MADTQTGELPEEKRGSPKPDRKVKTTIIPLSERRILEIDQIHGKRRIWHISGDNIIYKPWRAIDT